MSNVYALLIGINDYTQATDVGNLKGCLNDIAFYSEYLKERFSKELLHAEILTDRDATRENIVNGFREHLGKARKDDVALFVFCGHGAQWKTASAFGTFSADGMDEGRICYDSRSETQPYDLADKELAILMHELSQNEPQITVLMDSCHSGSATRSAGDMMGLMPRNAPGVSEARPLESYLDGYYAGKSESHLVVPDSRHILISACRDDQTAKEFWGDQKRGVFSTALEQILQKSSSTPTYADLFIRCRNQVVLEDLDQLPQFETYGGFNANQEFLGSGSRNKKVFPVTFDKKWKVACGAANYGLPTDPDKPSVFALYEEGGDEPVGTIRSTKVMLESSTVEAEDEFEFKEGGTYTAQLVSLPVPPLPVYVSPEEPVRQAVLGAIGDMQSFLHVTETISSCRYGLKTEEGNTWLYNVMTGENIQGSAGTDQEAIDKLLLYGKVVADWERLKELQNHATTLDEKKVGIELVHISPEGGNDRYLVQSHGTGHTRIVDAASDEPVTGNRLEVMYSKEVHQFQVTLQNDLKSPLYVSMLYFSRDFGIKRWTRLNLEKEVIPAGFSGIFTDSVYLSLDDGVNEEDNIFKLVFSTQPIDTFLIEQEGLVLGRLIKSGERGASDTPPQEKRDDWFTRTFNLHMFRQVDAVDASRSATFLQGAIEIKPHASLQADLRMESVQRSRAAGGSGVLPALESFGLAPLSLSRTRAGGTEVLELNNIKNPEAVAENPLEIIIKTDEPQPDSAGNESFIVPMAFDGNHFLIVGDSDPVADGQTTVRITDIPDVPGGSRSLGSALKLYFFSTYLDQSVDKLRWVDYSDEEGRQREGVAEKVASAKNILLCIHGIIGDTRGMAQALPEIKDADGRSLADRFDLVLTFDYENLNRPIAKSAKMLKKMLGDVGIGPRDDKKLTILAHSMGGLVSRHFVEQEGGASFVDHLVMCGTPNAGSPFGKIGLARKGLTALATLALNYAPAAAPFAAGFVFLLSRSKKITHTLEEMNAGSDFFMTLNDVTVDPGVRYTILAGDINTYQEPSASFMPELVERLGKGKLFDKLFANDPHDIAVSVNSIRTVNPARDPAPVKYNVSCHHLNYFTSPQGKAKLAQLDW